MAEAVDVRQRRVLAVEGQVRPVDHVAAGEAGHRGDAGVEQCDADALARQSALVGVVRSDDLGDVVERALVGDRVVPQGRITAACAGPIAAPRNTAPSAVAAMPRAARRPDDPPCSGDTLLPALSQLLRIQQLPRGEQHSQ